MIAFLLGVGALLAALLLGMAVILMAHYLSRYVRSGRHVHDRSKSEWLGDSDAHINHHHENEH